MQDREVYEQDSAGNVVLTMPKADYELLMLALNAASMVAVRNPASSRLTISSLLGLINRIHGRKSKGLGGGYRVNEEELPPS